MDWGYVTGYFDGEGNVCVVRPTGRSHSKTSLCFSNNNLASLKAIRNFIGCGNIRKQKNRPRCQQHYRLYIEIKEDVVRVAKSMLEHSIIKRERLIEAISAASVRIIPTGKRGALSAIGKDEIKRLYEDGLSVDDIARKAGVTYTATRRFMARNGIKRRSANDPIYNSRKQWSEASRRKLSETRTRQWKDPTYRAKQSASMRGSHSNR